LGDLFALWPSRASFDQDSDHAEPDWRQCGVALPDFVIHLDRYPVQDDSCPDRRVCHRLFPLQLHQDRISPDQWGRREVILAGLAANALVDPYVAVMERKFKASSNRVGKSLLSWASISLEHRTICF
jgi:hypothetical protein